MNIILFDMKNAITLWLLIAILSSAFSQSSSCLEELDYANLFDYYWQQRDFAREYLEIENTSLDEDGNLIDDGIGEFSSDLCLFSKAGEALPGNLVYNGAPESYRVLLSFGGDMGIDLGYKIGYLAMEYSALFKSGDQDGAQLTLNELFLALQAYRRLDMTANRLVQRYLEECCRDSSDDDYGDSVYDANDVPANNHCQPRTCTYYSGVQDNKENLLRFDGYSGLFVRGDTPWDKSRICSEGDPAHLCPENSRSALTNFFNSIDGSSEASATPYCSQSDCSFSCCIQHMRDKNLFASQDQMIGILHGLAAVKRFVPSTAYVTLNGQTIYVLPIAEKIATGFALKLHSCGDLVLPSCDGGCDGDIQTSDDNGGNETIALRYGMRNTINYVTGSDWGSNLRDRVFYRVGRNINFRNPRLNGNFTFNSRMYLKLEATFDSEKSWCTYYCAANSINYLPAAFEREIYKGGEASCEDLSEFCRAQLFIHVCQYLSRIDCSVPCNFNDEYDFAEGCGSEDGFPFCIPHLFEDNEIDCDAWRQNQIYNPRDFLYLFQLLVQSGYGGSATEGALRRPDSPNIQQIEGYYCGDVVVSSSLPLGIDGSSTIVSVTPNTASVVISENRLLVHDYVAGQELTVCFVDQGQCGTQYETCVLVDDVQNPPPVPDPAFSFPSCLSALITFGDDDFGSHYRIKHFNAFAEVYSYPLFGDRMDLSSMSYGRNSIRLHGLSELLKATTGGFATINIEVVFENECGNEITKTYTLSYPWQGCDDKMIIPEWGFVVSPNPSSDGDFSIKLEGLTTAEVSDIIVYNYSDYSELDIEYLLDTEDHMETASCNVENYHSGLHVVTVLSKERGLNSELLWLGHSTQSGID